MAQNGGAFTSIAPIPQCHQILELQNRDHKHSFTNAVVRCSDGFFRTHHGVLRAGSSLSASKSIDATSWTVEQMSPAVFLFYLGEGRATFHENHGPQFYKDQLLCRLQALGADTTKVALSVPLELDVVRGRERNELMDELSSSLDLRYLRYTRTDTQGNHVGDYLISTDGDTIPVPSVEPMSPPAPVSDDADSSEDGSRIEGAPENLGVSSPTLCSCGCCGASINRERSSSPYDCFRVVSQPVLPPALAPTHSLCGVSRIGQVPENLDVPSRTMHSVRIEWETNPSPSDSFSCENNINGVAGNSSAGNPRTRRPREEEVDSENIPSNPVKRPRSLDNHHDVASSSNRGRPLAPLINIILSQSPPLLQSHHSHQGPGHVCKLPNCGYTFFTVTEFLRHTNHDHRLFKLRHYRLRTVPWCLICNSRKRLLHATPEDFTNHVYECLQSKREQLGAEWEPPLQGQKSIYSIVYGATKWYEQLEDSPISFTEEEYNQIIQEDSSSDEEDESDDDDSSLSSADPEEYVENVLESPSDTEDEDDLCLQIVTEDIAQRVLNSCF